MSKNYTNYNKPKETKKQNEDHMAVTLEDNEQATTPVVDVTSLDQTDTTADPATQVTPEDDEQTSTPESTPEAEPIIGVVSNCKMLNVRAAADKKADIITIFNAGTEVEIIEEGSTDEFYHIHHVSADEINTFGYCMKDFITIK